MSDKKTTVANSAPPAPPVPASTEADQMWSEISNLPINLFALGNRRVHQHVTKLTVPGVPKLFVKLSSQAVLPALEETLGKKFTVEPAEGFVTITRTVDHGPLVQQALRDLNK